MRIAITREISPAINRCELTHLTRDSIDVALARRQHEAYEQRLREAGYAVTRLDAGAEMADSVFVEDTAVVFDELAVVTRPGAESRRAETAAVAGALRAYRPIAAIEPPGTLDGGDVLTIGRGVFIGESVRTNAAAISQMRSLLEPYGYRVVGVAVRGCLHLKSAVTAVADDTLLINRAWAPADLFGAFELIDVDPAESLGANALRLHDRIVYPAMFPRTGERLAAKGFRVVGVDVGEIAKAEGAVTCCSVILDRR
jgi:dimethylargininase